MLLILIFAYNFFHKKYQINLSVVYVFHITLLHTCLAIKHCIGVLGSTQLCRFLTYATYYSLVACFAALLVVCYCFWRQLNKNVSNEDTSEETELQDFTNGHPQSTKTANQKADNQQDSKYKTIQIVLAFAVPLVFTLVVFIIDAMRNLYDFNQCFRVQFGIKNIELSYAVVPIIILMVFGIITLYLITIQLNDFDKRNRKIQNSGLRYAKLFFDSG